MNHFPCHNLDNAYKIILEIVTIGAAIYIFALKRQKTTKDRSQHVEHL